MIFQISVIKHNHPDLYNFLFAETNENLFNLGWSLATGYDLELQNKVVSHLPLLNITAAISTPAHFKILVDIKHKKFHQNERKQELVSSFKIAVRFDNIVMVAYLLETYPSLNNSKLLETTIEVAKKYNLDQSYQLLITKIRTPESIQTNNELESVRSILPIKPSPSNTHKTVKKVHFSEEVTIYPITRYINEKEIVIAPCQHDTVKIRLEEPESLGLSLRPYL